MTGLEGLIGTEACEAHGHGFRVDLKTIQKAQEIHNPEIYELVSRLVLLFIFCCSKKFWIFFKKKKD